MSRISNCLWDQKDPITEGQLGGPRCRAPGVLPSVYLPALLLPVVPKSPQFPEYRDQTSHPFLSQLQRVMERTPGNQNIPVSLPIIAYQMPCSKQCGCLQSDMRTSRNQKRGPVRTECQFKNLLLIYLKYSWLHKEEVKRISNIPSWSSRYSLAG